MKEYDFIEYISRKRRQSPAQLNKAFEADAEIVLLNGSLWAFTVDEFSAEEDSFIHEDSRVIGWNLAVATLSDLFACGIKPGFFMQTLLRSIADRDIFYKKLTDGVLEVLDACDCFLLGGDTGSAANWRYSGIAFGEVRHNAVTRVVGQREKQDIWITGACGDANAALLRGADIPRFELRLDEADIIGEFASACTDTSGGFCDAVWSLRKVNPFLEFKIDIDMIPFAPDLLKCDLPPEMGLIGGAGEYELLLLAPEYRADEFKNHPAFTWIGSACPTVSVCSEVSFFRNGAAAGEMRQPPPCYRSCLKTDYLKVTAEYYERSFKKRKR
ncbi:MAG: AIR synthase related protein [Victivallales bacterium]